MGESSTRQITKDKQKNSGLINLAIAIVFCSTTATFLFGGCSSPTQTSGPQKVQTQDDANKVLIIIVDQAKEAAPGYNSISWGDTTVNGAIAGSAVVIGSYQEVWSGSDLLESYQNVQVSYNSYCSDNSYPTITGNAAISGTITDHVSFTSDYYSGAWHFAALVRLDGNRCSDKTWAYSDSVLCSVTFSTPYDYSGWIKCGSTTWNVSNASD